MTWAGRFTVFLLLAIACTIVLDPPSVTLVCNDERVDDALVDATGTDPELPGESSAPPPAATPGDRPSSQPPRIITARLLALDAAHLLDGVQPTLDHPPHTL